MWGGGGGRGGGGPRSLGLTGECLCLSAAQGRILFSTILEDT